MSMKHDRSGDSLGTLVVLLPCVGSLATLPLNISTTDSILDGTREVGVVEPDECCLQAFVLNEASSSDVGQEHGGNRPLPTVDGIFGMSFGILSLACR